jgi:hypothetical protein
MILESLTKGFEHGHFHHHHEEKNILPIALMFGMFIHAFLEGIPLANITEITLLIYWELYFIIYPFLLFWELFYWEKKFCFSWIIVGIFALASPLGMFLVIILILIYRITFWHW